ncbi:methyl-accepting chemotaxis protein [Cellulomonas sp. Y8]|uniref:methyl-accepting chemotaxis protein n=1 Tax=Cellulomonas sp. Y8 TaxID=2591145 RepID=UPI003D73D7D8
MAGTARTDDIGLYREALEAIAETCARLAAGDFETRVPVIEGDEVVQGVRQRLNAFIDITDAFVRESGASLTAASEGRYHRQFLQRGMPGVFRVTAGTINAAGQGMRQAAEQLEQDLRDRDALAETMSGIAAQVAAASVELSASADSLADSAGAAVDQAQNATDTMHTLERSSQQIQEALTLIKNVASRTKLLALNATIEATRAGDAGRGFAVVATEVKALADETHRSSDDIEVQIQAAQQAARNSIEAVSAISDVIAEMNHQVGGIAAAAGGTSSAYGDGLAQMAETLRTEIDTLVARTGRANPDAEAAATAATRGALA